MDKKFKDLTFKEKIAYIIVVLLISSLLMGSFGGLLYLFGPKEHKTASADNSLVYEVTVPIIWQFDNDYITQSLIFNGSGNIQMSYMTYSNGALVRSSITNNSSNSQYTLDFATSQSGVNIPLFITFGYSGASPSFNYLTLVYYEVRQGSNGYAQITLYDNNGNICVVSFYKSPLGTSYTFSDSYNNGINRRYSTISDLNNMINNATQSGFDNGYDEGYDYGFELGKEYGEDIGYQKGANDSEQFTFAKLLDAVFYAPIKAFTSIFNFDFLGVNLLSIVSFILTVCIVVGLLKWLV